MWEFVSNNILLSSLLAAAGGVVFVAAGIGIVAGLKYLNETPYKPTPTEYRPVPATNQLEETRQIDLSGTAGLVAVSTDITEKLDLILQNQNNASDMLTILQEGEAWLASRKEEHDTNGPGFY